MRSSYASNLDIVRSGGVTSGLLYGSKVGRRQLRGGAQKNRNDALTDLDSQLIMCLLLVRMAFCSFCKEAQIFAGKFRV